MAYKELDPVLHSPLRLAIVSLLVGLKEADFSYVKEATQSTAGNVSIQLTRLKEAGYIDVEKKFKKNYPLTICKITPKGAEAFEKYVTALKEYLVPAEAPVKAKAKVEKKEKITEGEAKLAPVINIVVKRR